MKEKTKSLEEQLSVVQEDTAALQSHSEVVKQGDITVADSVLADISQLQSDALWDWNTYLLWNQCVEKGYFLSGVLDDYSTCFFY